MTLPKYARPNFTIHWILIAMGTAFATLAYAYRIGSENGRTEIRQAVNAIATLEDQYQDNPYN